MHDRALTIDLPPAQSAFAWGPGKVGKSTFLRTGFPGYSSASRVARDPGRAPPAALARPIIMDEVQKVPEMLDEVHWLIESRRLGFILCASSARKQGALERRA